MKKIGTRLHHSLLLALCFSQAAIAQTLQLQRGEYVLKSSKCSDAPNAAILLWNGIGFSGAHSSGCTSQITRRADGKYGISTACKAQGDGTLNPPGVKNNEFLTLTRLSSTRFTVTKPSGNEMAYHWCGVKRVN